ncbi:hypothetical protein JCM25156A_08520 [Komagataeibacter kakiaceti JCM 25156]
MQAGHWRDGDIHPPVFRLGLLVGLHRGEEAIAIKTQAHIVMPSIRQQGLPGKNILDLYRWGHGVPVSKIIALERFQN